MGQQLLQSQSQRRSDCGGGSIVIGVIDATSVCAPFRKIAAGHEVNKQPEKTKIIEVSAAVLQRPDGTFLLAQRPPDKIWAGYWEFPGGKIEPGETPYHALVRELHEELGITVQTAYPWLTRVFTYPHATVRLNFFRVTAWSGELHPHEGQQFSWQHPDPRYRLIPSSPPTRPSCARWNCPLCMPSAMPPSWAWSHSWQGCKPG